MYKDTDVDLNTFMDIRVMETKVLFEDVMFI